MTDSYLGSHHPPGPRPAPVLSRPSAVRHGRVGRLDPRGLWRSV